MMDIVRKNGDKINIEELSRELGCRVVEVSALKGSGVMEAAQAAVEAANGPKTVARHSFSGAVEHAIAHIEEAAVHNLPEEQQRWYAIKIFERDEKVLSGLGIGKALLGHIEQDIKAAEQELGDDAESIITNERYLYIASIIKGCYKKKIGGRLPHQIKSTVWSQTAGRRCRFSRPSCLSFISYPFRRSVPGRPTGQTTACSAMAGTCLP